MTESKLVINYGFATILNFVLRNAKEIGHLTARNSYFRDRVRWFMLPHKEAVAFLTEADSSEITLTSGQSTAIEEKAFKITENLLRIFKDHCENFGFDSLYELELLSERKNVNTKLEILMQLKPGVKTSRKQLNKVAYRRKLSRALGRLAELDLITWKKRKEVALTQKGMELRKTILAGLQSSTS